MLQFSLKQPPVHVKYCECCPPIRDTNLEQTTNESKVSSTWIRLFSSKISYFSLNASEMYLKGTLSSNGCHCYWCLKTLTLGYPFLKNKVIKDIIWRYGSVVWWIFKTHDWNCLLKINLGNCGFSLMGISISRISIELHLYYVWRQINLCTNRCSLLIRLY